MGLTVTMISGPRGAGKSALIRAMIDHLWDRPPHYLRLAAADSDKQRPKLTKKRIPESDVASARWLRYDIDHIFEILPHALTAIHRDDRYGSVVIEADDDPALRHAYPYDYRIFVMPVPAMLREVFRHPKSAAAELRRALDDTAAFASEIFGLVPQDKQPEVDPSEDRADLTDAQMRGFLHSPLGDELATRIVLQPSYHALVESDVAVVNTGVGLRSSETEPCLRRIQKLLDRLGGKKAQRCVLFLCDPQDPDTKACRELFKALKPICQSRA